MDARSNPRSSRVLRWLDGNNNGGWGTRIEDWDPAFVEMVVDRMSLVFGRHRYFPVHATGFANLPAAPTMLVGNHSGGTSIPDVWGLMYVWYRYFGTSRPIHPVAHEMVFSNRFTGAFFSNGGVLRASRARAREVVETWRRDLLVLPGGDLDTWRPFRARYDVRFGGRTGYARLALITGTPICPVAHVGAHHTLIVLADGQRLAKAMGLHDLARAEVFPVSLALPFGLMVGPLPHLPLPSRLWYRIGTPVPVPEDYLPGTEPTPAQIEAYDGRVRAALKAELDVLAHERRQDGLRARVARRLGRGRR